MCNRLLSFVTAALVAAALLGPAVPVAAQTDDESRQTFASATFLLRSSLQIYRDGRQIRLLRALRQLKDPDLAPLFGELVQSPNPVMKIHGLLGLAEIDPAGQLDLLRIAAIDDPATQAQAFSAAMDAEVFSPEQARQVIDWPGVDNAIKVLVAAPLVAKGQLNRPEVLAEAAKSDNLARRGLALVLQVQLGDAAAAEDLASLLKTRDARRDEVADMLFRTILRYDLRKLGGWALKVAQDPATDWRVMLLALKAALRFGVDGAQAQWTRLYLAEKDLAGKTRMALVALREAKSVTPEMFVPLAGEPDEVLKKIAAAGAAVAKGEGVAPAVVALVDMTPPHLVANAWALRYAESEARPEDARMILLALILAYQESRGQNPAQQLEDAISAAQVLADKFPDDAKALLQPVLASTQTPRNLVIGVLLGLVRSGSPRAHEVVLGLPPPADAGARQLALLLKAKHGHPLSRDEQTDLALLVRGGGLGDDSLRIQAAWTYLKLTRQTASALAQVLGQSPR